MRCDGDDDNDRQGVPHPSSSSLPPCNASGGGGAGGLPLREVPAQHAQLQLPVRLTSYSHHAHQRLKREHHALCCLSTGPGLLAHAPNWLAHVHLHCVHILSRLCLPMLMCVGLLQLRAVAERRRHLGQPVPLLLRRARESSPSTTMITAITTPPRASFIAPPSTDASSSHSHHPLALVCCAQAQILLKKTAEELYQLKSSGQSGEEAQEVTQ